MNQAPHTHRAEKPNNRIQAWGGRVGAVVLLGAVIWGNHNTIPDVAKDIVGVATGLDDIQVPGSAVFKH